MSEKFLILLGLLIILLAFPQIREPLLARLYNEGLLTPRYVKPEKAELIKFAGPNLSLFLLGLILIIIGLAI